MESLATTPNGRPYHSPDLGIWDVTSADDNAPRERERHPTPFGGRVYSICAACPGLSQRTRWSATIGNGVFRSVIGVPRVFSRMDLNRSHARGCRVM